MDKIPQPSPSRHALGVEKVVAASAEKIFDTFVALYDTERPYWVTDARLDLRPGGRWQLAFQVPNGPAFREDRLITAVDRPHRLAYTATASYDDAAELHTSVEITIEPAVGGQRIRLTQDGFPTTGTRDEFAQAWPDVLDEVARRVAAGQE